MSLYRSPRTQQRSNGFDPQRIRALVPQRHKRASGMEQICHPFPPAVLPGPYCDRSKKLSFVNEKLVGILFNEQRSLYLYNLLARPLKASQIWQQRLARNMEEQRRLKAKLREEELLDFEIRFGGTPRAAGHAFHIRYPTFAPNIPRPNFIQRPPAYFISGTPQYPHNEYPR